MRTMSTRRIDPDRRRAADTAPQRCIAYATCSELLASPHDVDPRSALSARMAAVHSLAPARGLEAAVAAVADAKLEPLRAEYSGLFEVGDQGPPVPLREELAHGGHGGLREEVVRYYEHFDYALAERFAWQPDHLSIELEFVHFLCYREATASGADAALPFQLAQLDFVERHLSDWIAAAAAQAEAARDAVLYPPVLRAVADFVAADAAWQRGTLTPDERP
jgi:DMSO reductase family type II enzyme chaperone